ncbi:MAG: hypothetical protein ABIH90_00515 [Candidatus Aenigmatarchaeota archaeon]
MLDSKWKPVLDDALGHMYDDRRFGHLLIVALYEGDLPPFCTHMPLDPEPETGVQINDFQTAYETAVATNNAARDGAVMVRLPEDVGSVPVITGWSFRLFPPPLDVARRYNRGSGYNSSLDFSGLEGVYCVYLANLTGVLRFDGGTETVLRRR